VLEAAERWGMPPWEIEATAPDVWMERAALWSNAKTKRIQKPLPDRGKPIKVGNKTKTRLV
jgi:hypothetical protein